MGEVRINNAKTRAIVRVFTRDELDEAAEAVLRYAQEECPVQTGRLLASHEIEKVSEDRRLISASTPYARDVYDGAQGRRPNRWLQRAIDRARL